MESLKREGGGGAKIVRARAEMIRKTITSALRVSGNSSSRPKCADSSPETRSSMAMTAQISQKRCFAKHRHHIVHGSRNPMYDMSIMARASIVWIAIYGRRHVLFNDLLNIIEKPAARRVTGYRTSSLFRQLLFCYTISHTSSVFYLPPRSSSSSLSPDTLVLAGGSVPQTLRLGGSAPLELPLH